MQEADLVCGICGAHGGYETAEVRDARRNGGGASCVGGQEKEWTGCFLDDLRAFGINADQWTTTAQDEGRNVAERQNNGRNIFHGEMDHYRENQGWTTAFSGMPERDGKDQEEDSPKQAGPC